MARVYDILLRRMKEKGSGGPETPEEVDAELRAAGFDPDEVGASIKAFAERLLGSGHEELAASATEGVAVGGRTRRSGNKTNVLSILVPLFAAAAIVVAIWALQVNREVARLSAEVVPEAYARDGARSKQAVAVVEMDEMLERLEADARWLRANPTQAGPVYLRFDTRAVADGGFPKIMVAPEVSGFEASLRAAGREGKRVALTVQGEGSGNLEEVVCSCGSSGRSQRMSKGSFELLLSSVSGDDQVRCSCRGDRRGEPQSREGALSPGSGVRTVVLSDVSPFWISRATTESPLASQEGRKPPDH